MAGADHAPRQYYGATLGALVAFAPTLLLPRGRVAQPVPEPAR